MDAKVLAAFWTDSKVEALDKDATLALLWLMTARVNAAGWVPMMTERRYVFESKTTLKDLQRACEGLAEGIIVHERGWWLRHFIRYQIGTGASLGKNLMARAVVKCFRDMPPDIIKACLEQYPDLHEITKPLGSPPQVLTKDKRGEEQRGDEDQGRGAGEGSEPAAKAGPPTWDEVKLFTAIRDAYAPVRRDAPQRVLEIIRDKVLMGANPEEMLAGTKECTRLYLAKFPLGTIGKYANKAVNFFADDLWNNPAAFALNFEGPTGADQKKEGAAGVSPSKRKHALDVEPEPGWRLALAVVVEAEGYALDPETVPWKELAGDIRQAVKDKMALGGSTPDMLDPRAG